jgi:hypothetical protein
MIINGGYVISNLSSILVYILHLICSAVYIEELCMDVYKAAADA